MRKSNLILLSVLLILTQACIPNLPAPTQDLNFLGTAIMSTMVSGATQTAVAGITPTPLISPSPLATSTPEVPTATPSATLSPTPIFTATSAVPLISVTVATNCRVGPGRVYDRVGALLVGQVSEVVGRNLNSNYWYIRNPNNANGFCWLWGEYATVTGNFAALPVFTPPPTPTPMPAFSAEYERLESCNGWWVDINLANTGGISFDSVSLTVRDRDTDVVTSMISDNFTDLDGCSESDSSERLNPGADRTVSSSPFTYDPRGHRLRATITLCSRDELSGTCITEVINFTP
jgi:hypothetical protein